MKILVTGAYGLVGSNLCKLLERDYPELEIVKVKFDVLEKFDTFDYIIHAAGYGQPLKFTEDKIKTIGVSTDLTRDLFNLLKPFGKFLFISTSEIYSGASTPYTEESIGTTTPQHPRACYIEGKRCGEAICMAYKEQGYNVKIARLALAYGPGTKKGDTRVLNQFIEQALTKGEIKVKDSGSAIRTYGYVEDIAAMMLDILFKGKDTVYNVGGISNLSIKELAEAIGLLTAVPVSFGEDKLEGAPEEVELSLNKIKEEFPDTTFTDIKTGLIKTINYQKELYGIK